MNAVVDTFARWRAMFAARPEPALIRARASGERVVAIIRLVVAFLIGGVASALEPGALVLGLSVLAVVYAAFIVWLSFRRNLTALPWLTTALDASLVTGALSVYLVYDQPVSFLFEGATVGRKRVLHNGAVTVRWQGIDCPELHYGRSAWYRQHWGQAPSVHLARFLRERSAGAGEVEVQVTTRVRRPNDVFDRYGRFVGDVLLGDVNLNHWMLEAGWAFPSLYNSLQQDEALAYLSAAAKGKSPLLDDYRDDLTLWDETLQTPRRAPAGRTYDEAQDRGWVQLPKMFRRIVDFQTRDLGGEGTLRAFLQERGHPERVFLTGDFLRLGNLALSYAVTQFIDDRDSFVAAPASLIFQESPSTLYGEDGHRVLEW